MPTPITRTSITTNLEARYKTQKEGSAFNAKLAGSSTIEPSVQSKLFEDSTKFDIDQQVGKSNFKGIVDGGDYKELSRFANNINTTPYKK